MKKEGKPLENFPEMDQIEINKEEEKFDMLNEKTLGKEKYDKLTNEQKLIVDTVFEKLHNKKRPALFFINGAGGCGKTFTYEVICHMARSENIRVSVMAPTGIAATLLPGGQTIHSRFGLDLKLTRSAINSNQKEWKELNDSEIFIIDEEPMMHKKILELINEKLKEITGINELFGNKIIILGGDFRQTLPIQKFATKSQLIDLSIKKSHFWRHFQKFNLSKNLRVLESEKIFSCFLLKMGDGKLNGENDMLELPDHLICYTDLVDEIIGEFSVGNNLKQMADRAILAFEC